MRWRQASMLGCPASVAYPGAGSRIATRRQVHDRICNVKSVWRILKAPVATNAKTWVVAQFGTSADVFDASNLGGFSRYMQRNYVTALCSPMKLACESMSQTTDNNTNLHNGMQARSLWRTRIVTNWYMNMLYTNVFVYNSQTYSLCINTLMP